MAIRMSIKNSLFHLIVRVLFFIAPVFLSSANATGTLPVPVVTIYPGDNISLSLLRDRRFSDQFIGYGGYVRDAAKLEGMVARRTLIKSRAIPENSIRKPYAVRNGQLIILRYKTGTLSIVARAVSLKSAIAGDYIQARNIDSGRTVTGLVQKDGSLLVSLK